jgi:glycosyltransferase involved in cell wall biosynthesis
MAIGDPASPALGEAAARLGATLEAFAPTGPDAREANPADVTRLPDGAAHFRSAALASALQERLQREPPDVVHFEELVMAQYAGAGATRRVLDRQKIDSAFHDACAQAGGPQADWQRAEAARFRRWERECLGLFDRVIVPGAGDVALLLPPASERGEVVATGVDEGFALPPSRTTAVDYVLLYGTLDYAPNVQAIETCLRDVWPRLRAERPELRLVIVGSGTPAASLASDDPRVELRGFVDDVAELLRGPGVLLAPLRIGGGSRTKILEALACGMPVVSTALGAENLGLEPGRHYLRAETGAEMTEAVLRLSREPNLVATLGRAGSARVEAAFRWPIMARQLERLYTSLLTGPSPRAASKTRALLVGVHPWPRDAAARQLSFPGQRTEQFAWALREAGCEVETVLLDEEGDRGREAEGVRVLAPERFRGGRELERIHDAFRPDLVIAAGGFHAARAASLLATGGPRWLDLPGDLPAEGQLRAARGGDGVFADYHAVLSAALAVGDRFSVVGPSQRLALIGQLGLAGRLAPEAVGRDPVAVIPIAVEGPELAPPLPTGGLRVAWVGGYNTWMDGETLFLGVEAAMQQRDDLAFVATGGPVPGHEESAHASFWTRARGSRFASRFVDHGRLPREQAREVLAGSHVLVCPSLASAEAELGSRLRIVEAMAMGRAVVVTSLGDLAGDVERAAAGIVVPAGDPQAVATALLRLAADRAALAAFAAQGRRLWQERFTYAATTIALRAWLRAPERWPGVGAVAGAAGERLRLQAELDAIRGSLTFRMLRRLDRLLGRR